jgi:pimeloyl-ACP methyl ester carboxylesterase
MGDLVKMAINNKVINVLEKIVLGGTKQWISLRSMNTDSPLILFLHGGPGTAQISFSRKPQKLLEKDFIVVNWDQRGAGRSYDKKLRKEDMTIDRFVLDAEELIEYLLKRFNQRKLFLVGHSWGTILGMKLAAKRPDLFLAYVGIGQVVNMLRGEVVSYQFTLDEANRCNNKKAKNELMKIGKPPYAKLKYGGIQRKWLDKFNGYTFQGSIYGKILRNLTLSDTSLLDIIKFVKGAMFSLSSLEEQQMKVDIPNEILNVSIPVYFCAGRRDYTVPFELVIEFAEKLIAPKKEIIWFEKSAHLPNFEEPDKFCNFCSSLKSIMSA